MGLVERFRNCCCRKILGSVIRSYSKGHLLCSLYCNNTYCANLCSLAEMIEDNSPTARFQMDQSHLHVNSQSKGYSVNCAITFTWYIYSDTNHFLKLLRGGERSVSVQVDADRHFLRG